MPVKEEAAIKEFSAIKASASEISNKAYDDNSPSTGALSFLIHFCFP